MGAAQGADVDQVVIGDSDDFVGQGRDLFGDEG